jgi:hypothetical protein
MEQFRQFILEFGPQHYGFGIPVSLLINTFAMWFTVNWMAKTGQKESIWRCFLCVVLLYIVSTISIYLLVFPSALIMIGAVLLWMVGSIIVIRSMFELPDGGIGILFMYIIILVATHGVIRMFVA